MSSPSEVGILAKSANSDDCTYLLPAFSRLGAPHWRSDLKASLSGMTAATGKAEIVRAAEESICFQITDVINAMKKDISIDIKEVSADGGMVRDEFLMQCQSDFLQLDVLPADFEELSGAGVAYMAGIHCGLYTNKDLFGSKGNRIYSPKMSAETREKKYDGWKGLF